MRPEPVLVNTVTASAICSKTEPADEVVKAALPSNRLILPLLISIMMYSLNNHGSLLDKFNRARRVEFGLQPISAGAHHLDNPTEVRVEVHDLIAFFVMKPY